MNLSVKTHVSTDKTLIFIYLSVKSTLFADILNIPLSPGGWHLQDRLAALDPIPRFAPDTSLYAEGGIGPRRCQPSGKREYYSLSIIRLKRAVIRPAAALPAMSTSSPSLRVVDSFVVLQMFVTTDIPNTRISL